MAISFRYSSRTATPAAPKRAVRRGAIWRSFFVAALLVGSAACTEEETPPSTGGTTGTGGGGGGGACSRAAMQSAIDGYFSALAAHDPSQLSLASNVKFTENGQVMQLGEGAVWQTAGELKFKRSAIDTTTCNSATEAVIQNEEAGRLQDIVYGLRLKLAGNNITEVEAFYVDPRNGWFPDPAGLLRTRNLDWETPLPPAERPSRAEMKLVIDRYFKLFPGGGCDLAPGCRRVENGFTLGCEVMMSCSTQNPDTVARPVMDPRVYVLDEETGVAVGFVMFMGGYTDFHMIPLRDGQIVGVHAILAPARSSGW